MFLKEGDEFRKNAKVKCWCTNSIEPNFYLSRNPDEMKLAFLGLYKRVKPMLGAIFGSFNHQNFDIVCSYT